MARMHPQCHVLAIVFVKNYMVQTAKVSQKGSLELERVTRVASVEIERLAWFAQFVMTSQVLFDFSRPQEYRPRDLAR